MTLHFADAFETVADLVPDRSAIVQGERRFTYRQYDEAAARFAAALEAVGVQADGKVGLYLYNSPEYLISQFGAFKNRAVPINVNYRYLDDELAYLLENSDSEVLVFHTSLGDRVARVVSKLPKIRLLVEVDDGGPHVEGAIEFSKLLAEHVPQPRRPRSGSDLYMLYTGGTTGMPKGVMFHHDEFVRGIYGGFAVEGVVVPEAVEQIRQVVAALDNSRGHLVSVACCPIMHGTGMWVSAMRAQLSGGTSVLLESRTFDAHELAAVVVRERATEVIIVGDAFARPILRALDERRAQGEAYDMSSVQLVLSSGAIWSAEIKEGLGLHMSALLFDGLGSTEGGSYGSTLSGGGTTAATAHFSLVPGTRVIHEDRRDVVPGSGEEGLLASESAAFGYFKDAAKTERTFLTLENKSYVVTGDWATVEGDGTITLLGRGSNCINSGGEKIYPEEVEEAVKRHPDIEDCLVVGVPDERFGQRVVAVASSSSAVLPTEDDLRAWLRGHLSSFKIPRQIVVLESVRRASNGKADYPWAREVAAAQPTSE